jgi:hypothetical protein
MAAERKKGSGGGGSRGGESSRGSTSAPGPSTRPVKEGLEGSILEGNESAQGEGQRRSTGAGSEATEGIHGASPGHDTARGESDRPGSEPMEGSEQQHVSGYGGAGGVPKTSSDQR